MKPYKPILSLDFDGVLHSYKSGWKGAHIIPDPPVPGAIEFLVNALDTFQVAIFSSRSGQWRGRLAMKRWLHGHLCALAPKWSETPEWWQRRIAKTAFSEPWEDEVEHAANLIVKAIQWPKAKPAAFLTIDDRALTFTGEWPDIHDLKGFKPWNKK